MGLQPVSVGGIEFDALISETKTYAADVPEYAVESGYSVSDNISIKPVTVDMTLYATNTPVTWLQRHGNSTGKVATIVAELERLYFKRQLVTVSTATDVYENMAITAMTVPKDEVNISSREISLSLKQVTIAVAASTSIPEEYGRGGDSGKNAGTAATSGSGNGKGGSSGGDSSSGKKKDSKEAGSILYNLLH